MSSEIEILKAFKESTLSFLDELISSFPQEPNLVLMRIMLKDQVPIINIMNHYIHKIIPTKNLIKDRDDTFFTKNEDLFGNLGDSSKDTFKKLWLSGQLDNDDKNIIWQWFDTFTLLAERCADIRLKNAQ